MSNLTVPTCPRGFIVQPKGFVQSLDFTQSHSFCIANCCVACPFQGTPSSFLTRTNSNRDNVPVIHATLSSRWCLVIRIPPPHLSPPPLLHRHPHQISSKHAKSLGRNRSLDPRLHQMFHHVSILRQDILSKFVPSRYVPKPAMWNPSISFNHWNPRCRLMGFYESLYPIGINYVSEIGYIGEMACCDECCLLGNSIGDCGWRDCDKEGGGCVWSSLWT